ncbi:ABC transporter C-terminal domain-containing protein [Kitasatospora sp. NPDC054768]
MAETVWATVFWSIVVVLAAAATVAWWMSLYPGTWRHAFDPRYSRERQRLGTARENLRRAEQNVAAEQEHARSAAANAAREHQARVRKAELDLAALRDPSFRGALLHSLGNHLDLYEHALRVHAGATHPLLGLTIDDQYSPTEAYIYLTPPDGQRELLTLALEDTPEADVRAFVVHVHNAIAGVGPALQRFRALIPEAEAELKRVTADTGNARRAEQKVQKVTAELNLRVSRARRELETAYDRWQELTGRRPT